MSDFVKCSTKIAYSRNGIMIKKRASHMFVTTSILSIFVDAPSLLNAYSNIKKKDCRNFSHLHKYRHIYVPTYTLFKYIYYSRIAHRITKRDEGISTFQILHVCKCITTSTLI